MSQRFELATGTRANTAVSCLAAPAVSFTWRTSFVGAAATATNKPSTHKHFAFAANYAAYAKRGSWSSIG